MKLVVGLGNPGPSYARTRHNVGFWVLDRLAERHRLRFGERDYKGQVARGSISGERCVLLKPQTYMNLSGEAIGRARRALKIDPVGILVVYDDLDLALGRLRVRDGGGAGGHHGVESAIESLGGKGFPRIRVGIGRPAGDAVDFLTDEPVTAEELEVLEPAVERAAEAVETWLADGIGAAMNRFNASVPPSSRVDETVRPKGGKKSD
ncbi:MAG: aminoacyl-tRNA hydrolase [Candidatus Binatia bacterium]